LLRVNNASDDELLVVPVYYTFGYWKQTQPVAVQLAEGKNALTFMRATEASAPIAIKEFFLYVSEPDIPAPPTNSTPAPPAPRPNAFIEVPALTTCAKQGIADVPAQFCHQACEATGANYAGVKAAANFTGCFVVTSGPHDKTCIFNTNASAAVCPDQPCTVDGGIAQQLCLRQ